MKKFAQEVARVVVLAALAAGTFGVVLAWTGPTAAPPAGNTSAPINISSTAQTKAGAITVSDVCTSGGKCLSGALTSTGGKAFGGVFVAYSSNGAPEANNPFTGGISCPSWAPNALQTGAFWISQGPQWAGIYECTN